MNCIVDPRKLTHFDFGEAHPFKIYRLGLAYSLIESYGLMSDPSVFVIEPREATLEEARTFHKEGYLEVLQLADEGMWTPNLFSHGLGTSDNPVFPGVYVWAMLVAGASIQSAEEIVSGRAKIAFNMAGGLHHAMPSRASGFCHVNDVVLGINTLLEHWERVAYVDIDAHHGDGVQHAFYASDRVLTVSIHQSGQTIFPGSGFVDDIGDGPGRGYSVNVPLLPGARDDVYSMVIDELLVPLVESYDPDAIVTQLGADAILGDRVAGLGMTLRQFERFAKLFRSWERPWLALGGGGYDIANVVRAWTLAWATMNDIDLPNSIPQEWLTQAASYDLALTSLRGEEANAGSPSRVLNDAQQTIGELVKSVLPLVGQSR